MQPSEARYRSHVALVSFSARLLRLCITRIGQPMNALVAWYFVAVWGAGYVATKAGLQYAPPFTFLSLRFAFGLASSSSLTTESLPADASHRDSVACATPTSLDRALAETLAGPTIR